MDVTIELDGLGRQLSELSGRPDEADGSPAEAGEGADGPVFVDASGRRSKKLRRVGWVLAIACACYAVTLAVALIGGNSSAPWLQIPGVSDKSDADKVEIQPPQEDLPSVATPPGGVSAGPSPSESASVGPSAGSSDGTTGSPDPDTSDSKKPENDPVPGDPEPDPGVPDPDPDPGDPDPEVPDPGTDPDTDPEIPDPGTDPDPDPSETPGEPNPGQEGGQQAVAEGAP